MNQARTNGAKQGKSIRADNRDCEGNDESTQNTLHRVHS